jgi:hypothetical protein
MSDREISAQQRQRVAMVLQGAGLFDILLGAAFAVAAPMYFGGDATIDLILRVGGGAVALSGVALWWWGRSRRNASAPSGPVIWRRR